MQKSPVYIMSVVATAAIIGQRFIGLLTGAPCAAGAKPQGVANFPAAIGEAVGVDVLGTSIVEAGGAFAAGTALKSDAQGRAIAQGGTGEIAGYAVEAAAAAGQRVEILLRF
jgi:hypothetical protein